MKYSYVYILASQKNGTIYIGVTSDLVKRVWEHQSNLVEGFTKKYNIHTLVYYETFEDIEEAINREKYLKGKTRKYKVALVEKGNVNWADLYESII